MVSIRDNPAEHDGFTSSVELVGRRLREMRTQRGFSLRVLAERSGLNFNTLSLVERAKSSPSVSTLQQLAMALEVPITAFFESGPVEKHVVFTPSDQRPLAVFGSTQMQNLGKNLAGTVVQPFIVTLKPNMGSGDQKIIHTGHEFVYCLTGSLRYQIDQEEYLLNAGDSLLFEAYLPHCWENNGSDTAQILLIFFPSDEREKTGERHFSLQNMHKESTMKIAVITEDGNTISQHFGRAPFYKVFTIDEKIITGSEMRDKLGHNQFSGDANEEHHGDSHGLDSASHNKHTMMANTISDCQVIICGGMGMGAYDSMRRMQIQPIVTDLQNIEEAVQAYIDGKLVDHTEKLH